MFIVLYCLIIPLRRLSLKAISFLALSHDQIVTPTFAEAVEIDIVMKRRIRWVHDADHAGIVHVAACSDDATDDHQRGRFILVRTDRQTPEQAQAQQHPAHCTPCVVSE